MNLFYEAVRITCFNLIFKFFLLVLLAQTTFAAENPSEVAYIEFKNAINNVDRNTEQIKKLLKNSKDDLLSTEESRQLAAEVASALGLVNELDFFLKKGGSVIQPTNEGFAPIYYVAKFRGKNNVLDYLKNNQINIEQESVNAYFKRCAKGGAIEAIKLMLTESEDVPLPDEITISDVFKDSTQAEQPAVIKILINNDYASSTLLEKKY